MYNLNTKSLYGGFKIKAGGEIGTFSAYGNTFGTVDHANDKTMHGAFTKCIQGWAAKAEMPQFLGQHGHTENPIGIITSMKEDDMGLLFEGEFCLETQAGSEAYALVKMGALKRFSIGYKTVKEKMINGVNELHELDVKEISLVTFACNEDSLIQSVKSALVDNDNPMRGVQKALQAAGISKRQAQAAVDSIKAVRESEAEMANALEAFKIKAETPATTHDLEIKSEMSLGEFAGTVSEAIRKSAGGEGKYVYIQDIYMTYVIAHVYLEDDSAEYYLRIPYSVAENGDIMVGSGEVVVRHVSWLNETETEAMKNEDTITDGEKDLELNIESREIKSDEDIQEDIAPIENEVPIEPEEIKSEASTLTVDEIKSWFK